MRAQGATSGWPFALRETLARTAQASAGHLWAKVSPWPWTAGSSLFSEQRGSAERPHVKTRARPAQKGLRPRQGVKTQVCREPARAASGHAGGGASKLSVAYSGFLKARRLQWLTEAGMWAVWLLPFLF